MDSLSRATVWPVVTQAEVTVAAARRAEMRKPAAVVVVAQVAEGVAWMETGMFTAAVAVVRVGRERW